MDYPQKIQNLIKKFSGLPTIGPKTAERIVLYLLSKKQNEIDEFSSSLSDLKGNISHCEICSIFSDNNICQFCSSSKREKNIICVVAKPQDVIAIEKTHNYSGVYHILGGVVNPIEGIHLEQLNFQKLVERIEKNNIREIILAFNPDIEGETTILSLQKYFKPKKIKITKLARGLPMGSDIEYADEVTLTDALKGRKDI